MVSSSLAFPKIARLFRDCIITEKLDGSNAQVIVGEDGTVAAGSRNRLITPGKGTDNYGFAGWVAENAEMLRRLGPGRHFGEWWGQGINRGYGMTEKVFSLFNVTRCEKNPPPDCCRVVPVLYRGPFSTAFAHRFLDDLNFEGSKAAPGFMKPEGIVVFHEASGTLFKATIENDESPKTKVAA
jgi:hypothetical protein